MNTTSQKNKVCDDLLLIVLDSIDAIVYVADMQTYEIIFANKNLKEFINIKELEGKICWQVLQKGQTGPCPFCTNRFLLDHSGRPKKESFEWEFKNTKTNKWLSIKDRAIYWIDGRIVRVEVAIDITKTKELQETLVSKEQKLSSVINSTSEGYLEIDLNNNVIKVNKAFCNTLELQEKDIKGKSVYALLDDENAKVLKEQESFRAIKRHRSFNLTFKKPNGSEVYTRVHATTLQDIKGEILGTFAFITDITELLQIEGSVARYAEELERSNRDLQDFAYIASHDLQEPLRKIIAFGDRLHNVANSVLDEQSRDYLRRMQNAALRMQHFIDDLLQYSRINTKAKPFEPVDLKVIIQEALIDLEQSIIQNDAIIVMGELPIIEGDPLQIRQLFFNILSNAIKFRKKHDTPFIKITYNLLPNNIVEIIIEDNGIGFDERYIDKLFKPFSRLHGKQEYPGTGMGLAICDKIIKRHCGSISVSSKIGVGSIFRVTLPAKQVGTVVCEKTLQVANFKIH